MMNSESTPFDSVDQVMDDDNESLVLCTVDLYDADGEPIVGERISILPRYVPPYPVSLQVFAHQTLELVTDEAGHAHALLLAGMEVDVFRSATGESWVCRVPLDVAQFELIG